MPTVVDVGEMMTSFAFSSTTRESPIALRYQLAKRAHDGSHATVCARAGAAFSTAAPTVAMICSAICRGSE